MAVVLRKQWGILVSCTCQTYTGSQYKHIFGIFVQLIQISAYFYVNVQNLVKIRFSAAELLHIFYFQYGGRADAIADEERFVFDGPNILLKLPFDRIYTSQDIVIFIFGPFGLKLSIHAPCGEFLGDITA